MHFKLKPFSIMPEKVLISSIQRVSPVLLTSLLRKILSTSRKESRLFAGAFHVIK